MRVVARRVVDALPTVTGIVLVRDRCGRADIVEEVVDECRMRGLDAVVEHVSNDRLRELIGSGSPVELARWDLERADLTPAVNGLIVLGGWRADLAGLPTESVQAWVAATGRVERVLEERNVPTVVVAVPTGYVAERLGVGLAELEARVLPGLLVSSFTLSDSATPFVGALDANSRVDVMTAAGTLAVDRGSRPVMVDDGRVDPVDIARGAVVSNLPGGSLYWTVIEEATRGEIELADGTVLRFDNQGRVIFGEYAGERVSHLGIAVNPLVTGAIGWTIVDEHRPGAVFLALGENRYMGGDNESRINVDLVPASPTVVAGGSTLVRDGILVADSIEQG
jgi:leucyl aminopeptidase (aminopeptidase T)